ncbi:MAG: BadF/BadG/BcrA/BcrD ATPase family protein, partial [Terriglobales bacterium]
MELLVGMDGGGTKTDLVAAARWGGARVRARVGASSLSRNSPEAVAGELARGCRELLSAWGAQAEDCVAVCGGFASATQNQTQYERILHPLLPRARVLVMSDAELALWAAVGDSDGIVVIAGTGSIARGRRGGQQVRVGGAGP